MYQPVCLYISPRYTGPKNWYMLGSYMKQQGDNWHITNIEWYEYHQEYAHTYHITFMIHMFINKVLAITLHPDNKVHGANMGPTWVLSSPGRSHEPCYLGKYQIIYMWYYQLPLVCWWGGHFKNTYELFNLRALKISPVRKIHWKIRFLYNTEILRALRLKSSYAFWTPHSKVFCHSILQYLQSP